MRRSRACRFLLAAGLLAAERASSAPPPGALLLPIRIAAALPLHGALPATTKKPELSWWTHLDAGVEALEIDFRWLSLPARDQVFPALQVLFDRDWGGYIGAQAPRASIAHFALWDRLATGEESFPWSPNAKRFDGEGTGAQASIPMRWRTYDWYTFRVEAGPVFEVLPGHRWRVWRTTITPAGLLGVRPREVGAIAVPEHAGRIRRLNGWIEYVTGPPGCDQEPVRVEWRNLRLLGARVSSGAIFYSPACGNVSGQPTRDGVVLGVGRGVVPTAEPGEYFRLRGNT
jgi:hypothetical protein